MTSTILPTAILQDTLTRLREGGRRRHERVVLWLAPAAGGAATTIQEAYEPQQETAKDAFYLPPHSLQALMERLHRGRLRVVGQIHTHPKAAFHSKADAEWAIVRHVGALSLVLPRFAATTTVANFLDEVKTYQLSETRLWTLTPNLGPLAPIVIQP